MHSWSKHRLCEDVAKQPKNNLKGMKREGRENITASLCRAQRMDGIVFISTEEAMNPVSKHGVIKQKPGTDRLPVRLPELGSFPAGSKCSLRGG